MRRLLVGGAVLLLAIAVLAYWRLSSSSGPVFLEFPAGATARWSPSGDTLEVTSPEEIGVRYLLEADGAARCEIRIERDGHLPVDSGWDPSSETLLFLYPEEEIVIGYSASCEETASERPWGDVPSTKPPPDHRLLDVLSDGTRLLSGPGLHRYRPGGVLEEIGISNSTGEVSAPLGPARLDVRTGRLAYLDVGVEPCLLRVLAPEPGGYREAAAMPCEEHVRFRPVAWTSDGSLFATDVRDEAGAGGPSRFFGERVLTWAEGRGWSSTPLPDSALSASRRNGIFPLPDGSGLIVATAGGGSSAAMSCYSWPELGLRWRLPGTFSNLSVSAAPGMRIVASFEDGATRGIGIIDARDPAIPIRVD